MREIYCDNCNKPLEGSTENVNHLRLQATISWREYDPEVEAWKYAYLTERPKQWISFCTGECLVAYLERRRRTKTTDYAPLKTFANLI